MKPALAICCFFLSGFAGLVYEVSWIKKATLVFGSATFALSSVLAIFFAGLALGSYLAGRWALLLDRPIRWYGVLEIILAALALASPLAFTMAEGLYGPVYRTFTGNTFLLFTLRILIISLVLLPPTVVMGATLPLFCRQFVTSRSRIASSVGFLYGVNTLGAATGCALAGFLLLPQLGVMGSIRLAALVNIVIGVVAILLPLRAPVSTSELRAQVARLPDSVTNRTDRRRTLIVFTLFFQVGLVALGLEVVWTRFLALLVRNSVYTYTITLTVVLLGIVAGSSLAALVGDGRLPRALWFGILQVLTGLTIWVLMLLPVEFWRGLGEGLTPFFVLMLIPAILSGASFPLANRLILDDPSLSASKVGRMAAVNTLGGITGALLIGFVGLPVFGLTPSLRFLTGLALLGGFATWLLLAQDVSRTLRLALAIPAIIIWFAIPAVTSSRLPADYLAPREMLVDFREGYTSSLAVLRNKGSLQLEIDRLWQGKDQKNHQIMAAHIPMLVHPGPQRVLVVGIGTGQTASRFLMYDIAQLACVDIEPTIFPFISQHFPNEWLQDPRVELIPEDGRTYLTHSDAVFDLISLEVGQVFRPVVAAFYSVEFYELAAERLAPGGMLSQFVPLPFFTRDEFRNVVATFLQVFPESILWYNSAELLLMGLKDARFHFGENRMDLLQGDEQLHADLRFSQWGGQQHWLNERQNHLAGFLCGPRELASLANGASVLTDDLPALAYATSRVKTSERLEVESVQLIREHLSPVTDYLDGPLSIDETTAILEQRERNLRDIVAAAHLRSVENLQYALGPQRTIEALELALRWNPNNAVAHRMHGEALVLARRYQEAEQSFRRALTLNDSDPLARRDLAYTLLQTGRAAVAIPQLERVILQMPQDPAAHNYLGAAYAQQGRLPEAIKQFQESLRLNPSDESVRYNLERARQESRTRPH